MSYMPRHPLDTDYLRAASARSRLAFMALALDGQAKERRQMLLDFALDARIIIESEIIPLLQPFRLAVKE